MSIDKLYNTLKQTGLYTNSFEEFETKFKKIEYRKKVYDTVVSTGMYNKDLDSFEDQYLTNIGQGQAFSQLGATVLGLAEGAVDLLEEGQASIEFLNKQFSDWSKTGKFNKLSVEEKDIIRNNIKAQGAGIGKMRIRSAMFDPIINKISENIVTYDDTITEALMKDDVDWTEVGSRIAAGGLASIPSLILATTPAGLTLLGASSAGNKWEEEYELDPEKSGGALFANAVGTGLIEAGGEFLTGKLIRAAGIMKQAGAPTQAIKELTEGTSTRILKTLGIPVGEGLTEAAQNLSVKLLDQIQLGKKIDWEQALYEASDEGIIGAFSGGGVATIGAMGNTNSIRRRRAESLLASPESRQRQVEAYRNISKYVNQLKDADKATQEVLEEKIREEENKIYEEKINVSKALENLEDNDLMNYAKNIEKLNEINKSIKNPDNKNKADVQDLLKNKFNDIAEQNQKLLDNAVRQRLTTNIQAVKKEAAKKGIKNVKVLSDKQFQQEYKKTKQGKNLDDTQLARVSQTSNGYFNKATNEIIINKDTAANFGSVTVASHELLHPILNTVIGSAKSQAQAVSDFKNILSSKQVSLMEQEMRDRGYSKEDEATEYFNVFLDAVGKKRSEIKFEKNLFLRIGDFLKSLFGRYGIKNMDFKSAEGVFNFLQEYNKGAERGEFTQEVSDIIGDLDKVDLESDIQESRQASQNVQRIYEQRGIEGAMDIIKEFDPIVNNIVNRFKEVPGFEAKLLRDEIQTGRRGILDMIMEYNPEKAKGAPLAGYINSFIKQRAIEAANRVLKTEFEADVTEARGVIAEETVAPEVTTKPKARKINPIDLVTEPSLKQKYIDDVISKLQDLDPTKLTFKKLKDLSADNTAKIFDVPVKKVTDPTANLTKQEKENALRFIRSNALDLISLLPKGAITEAASEKLLGTSTGVPKSLLNNFYTKQERITKGAGLSPYTKNRNISKSDFLKAFGIVEGKKSTDFGPRTPEAQAVKAMMSLYGKLATNSIVRDQLRKQGELQSVIEDIAAGKSELQFSKGSAYTGVTNEQLLDSFKKKNKSLKYYRVNDGIYDEKTGQTNLEKYADDMANIAIEFENKYGPGLFNLSMISNRKGLGGISREQRAKIQEIITKKVPNIGKRSKNNIYSKKKIDTKFLKTATKKQIKDLNKKNMMLHKEFWMTIRDIVSKDKSSLMSILNMLDISQSEGGHIQRLGAEYLGGHKDVNKIQHLEHALQNANTYRLLLDAAVNQNKDNFTKTYEATVKNYKIIGLPNADNNLLNETDFKNKMSLDESWNVFENSWWQRYFNQTVGDAGGINPVDLITLDGKTFAEEFGVDIYGGKSNLSIEQAKNKVKIKYPKVLQFSKVRRNNKILNDLNDYDTALRNARNLNAPVKGISIFDFDDTLATTKSKIIVNMPDGKVKKITPAEFAKQHSKLEEQGATFDFNEFNKVVRGKPALAANKLKKAIEKFGNKDVFVLTARPQASAQAIYEFLKGIGLEIPLKNITGLENGTPQAKANWVVSKAAEGYNDFYFTDDVYKNVKAVQDALEVLDVKSKSRIAYVDRVAKLDKDFNDIIEAKTGIAAEKEYSIAKAKAVGSSKGKFTFFIPPSAEDFVGLLYPTLAKGKLGDNQMAWYKKNLLDPFARANANISRERIALMNDYKALKKQLKIVPKNLRKNIEGEPYTNEQAVRVYIWNKQGMTIPGLSKTDLKELTDYIENKPDLKIFGDQLISIQKGDEYNKPNSGWLAGSITTDIQAGLGGTKRAKHLAEWQQNADIIFSEKNLNKMEAAFGKAHRIALEGVLKRMKTGVNRSFQTDNLTGKFTDWLTNSIGTIMFFNTRSALLQTISAVNFINFKDNNIFAASKAYANQPQFWSDFMKLMNSDFLVDRRRGLRINVNEADIANMARESGVRGAISKLLEIGFLPTQIADSFAIASGGATFYRNRIKTYEKQGLSKNEAEAKAMDDFREIAEESQQSSRPDRISAQQAGPLGRIILAFGNTPMQYARLIKKAASDLKNRRGDWKTNTSKIIYYGVVQNLIFNALQQAIFAIAFGESDEDKEEKKYFSIANGMADSLLRGIGIAGAFVSVGKNAIIRIINESEKPNPKYEKIGYELTRISPPISSKLSKLNQAARSLQWEKDEMLQKGLSYDNPAWLAGANVISAITNIPLDRLVKKTTNVVDATGQDVEMWERLALLGGWSKWELDMTDDRKKKKKKKNDITLYQIK